MKEIRQAEWIGEGVQDILNQPGQLQIFGDTSKGIFFKHSSQRILFLSRESARGPLTIVLGQPGHIQIRDNAEAELVSDGILIDKELEISLADARIWKPPSYLQPTSNPVQSMVIRAIRLRSLLESKQESLLNKIPLLQDDPALSISLDESIYNRFQPLVEEFEFAPSARQI